ncbi:MAG: zinc dependent phospholipase C family protein [Anaerolineae bacterium]|jgi:hypothetical protein
MAPFLTHLVVGERVWTALDGVRSGPDNYGTFLFGCLAPDVDKFCHGLEQSTTHFVAKDEAATWAWLRSQHFLEEQTTFLRAPFDSLEAVEQAFVIGYLCHVATDEITGRYAQDIKSQHVAHNTPLPHVDAILTAMDPQCWALAGDPEHLVSALDQVVNQALIPDRAFVFTEPDCLRAILRAVVPQVAEGGGLMPCVSMVRRQWQWLRHGQVSDEPNDPQLEADLAAFRRRIETDLPNSELLVDKMDLERFVQEAQQHSLQRIHALLAGRRLR